LDTVNRELALYNPSMGTKLQIIVLNKLDLPEAAQKAEIFRQALPGEDILTISAQKAEGLAALTSKLTQLLDCE
jgi:GTP-binding protein